MSSRRPRQETFRFRTWGGKRANAGRKRTKPGRPCVPHRARPPHKTAHPVHVTLRAREGLPPFRDSGIFFELRAAIREASRSPAVGEGFRVIEFSVQNDHAHFIIERSESRASRERQRVGRSLSRARLEDAAGRAQCAIVYVLMNAKKHGMHTSRRIDMFSSAPWFEGFVRRVETNDDGERPIVSARTWLGGVGRRRRGLVHFDERPRAPD